MPELKVGQSSWVVAPGSNLLDSLLQVGQRIPHSCRAGSCHACLVRCLTGEVYDALPDALDRERRAQGWRLACQCQILEDVQVALFDPEQEGMSASVVSVDWLSRDLVRLRVVPERSVRYQAGQHLLLWHKNIARPYSIASLPGAEPWLEFHLDCSRPGAFCDAAREVKPGDTLRLGALSHSALYYPAETPDAPLWLIASGSGLAPLWGILREALRQQHSGPIHVVHRARTKEGHYLQLSLDVLATEHANLSIDYLDDETWAAWLKALRLPSRQTVALACGGTVFIEELSRQMFMAGLPRRQLLTDTYFSRSG